MALIYAYDKMLSNPTNAIRRQRAKAEKALLKKNVPQDASTGFLDGIQRDGDIKTAMVALQNTVTKARSKSIGNDVLEKFMLNPKTRKSPITKIFAQIVGRQLQLKLSDVALEIHAKANTLELWFKAKGGGKRILYSANIG